MGASVGKANVMITNLPTVTHNHARAQATLLHMACNQKTPSLEAVKLLTAGKSKLVKKVRCYTGGGDCMCLPVDASRTAAVPLLHDS